jgi:hypothetical protein
VGKVAAALDLGDGVKADCGTRAVEDLTTLITVGVIEAVEQIAGRAVAFAKQSLVDDRAREVGLGFVKRRVA